MREQSPQQVIASLLGVGGLVALVIAFAQFASAGQNEKLAGRIKPKPQTMTAEDLGRSGPGDNLYVHVTNLEFGDDTLTVRSSKSSRWHRVFMPVYPKGTAAAARNSNRAPLIMVHSTSIGDAGELRSFQGRSSVVGIVTNPLEGVPSHVEKFKEKFPKFEGKDIWIVDVSREVPTATKAANSRFGACVLICVALGCFGGCGWMAYQMNQGRPAARPMHAAPAPGPEDLRRAVRLPGAEPGETTASELAAKFNPRRR